MAVAVNKKIKIKPNAERVSHPVKGTTRLYEGTFYFIDSTGYAVAITASGANKFGGLLESEADNSLGVDGGKWTKGVRAGLVVVEGSGFAQTSVGKRCYLTDNFTGTLTAAGGVDCGEIVRYIDATHVEVDIEKATPKFTLLGTDEGVRVAGGEIALDGANPTPITTGLTTVTGVVLTQKGSAAPGVGTSELTYTVTGGTINVYAWKPTSNVDTTLIASSGTETIGWMAIGT